MDLYPLQMISEKRGRGRGRGRGRLAQEPAGDLQLGLPPTMKFDDFIIPSPVNPNSYKLTDNIEISPPTSARKQKPRSISPDDLEKVGLRMEYKHVLEPELPRRPDRGVLGKKIKLCTNWFKINIPGGNVYHYDVEIVKKRVGEDRNLTPLYDVKKFRCLNTKWNRLVMSTMFAAFDEFKDSYPAYDGHKNMYTRYPLQNVPFTKEVVLNSTDESQAHGKLSAQEPKSLRDATHSTESDAYLVYVKPVLKKGCGGSFYEFGKLPAKSGSGGTSCAINLDAIHAFFDGTTHVIPQDALMAVETVLRNKPCLNLTPIGRSFFSPPADGDRIVLSGKQEIWFGYHQSLRIGDWPAVNIDISATTFYERGPVLDYVCSIMNLKKTDLYKKPQFFDSEVMRLTKELRNLRVRTNYLAASQRKYRIVRVTREPAKRITFTLNVNGTEEKISVPDYFRKQYNLTLKFPHFPCLQMSPESKSIFLPLETCEIAEGQPCRRMLSEEQKRDMVKFTSIEPKERFLKIADIVKNAEFNKDTCCREFGLTVEPNPVQVEGRVLEAPGLCYYDKQMVHPRDGQWDMRNKRFVRAVNIEKWVLISFSIDCKLPALKNFANDLLATASGLGINMSDPQEIKSIEGNDHRIEKVLSYVKGKFGDCFLFIIIPKFNKNLYAEIKQVAETFVGLTTQCVKSDKVLSRKPSLMSNLCLKMNAKLGGINCSLNPAQRPAIFSRPVIVIGADVTHCGSRDHSKPSIAAVVGSLDSFPAKYTATCRIQKSMDEDKKSIEIILDLKSMVMDVLRAFYRNTKGKKPEKIIFYRDGVSEGQFLRVKQHEVRAVRDACLTISPDYEPGITYVIVQKGHHTRFRPSDIRDGLGRSRNIPPGTTVDTTVVHPCNFDFFLCSQFGLQGTSRPARYTVIEDDNQFKADELQRLTYYLCYTYVRCTKSISTPAPVMYAHLAAFRARHHYVSQGDNSSEDSDGRSQNFLSSDQLTRIKVIENLKNTMYFV